MLYVHKFFSCQKYSKCDSLITRIEKVILRNPIANLWGYHASNLVKDEKYDLVFSIISSWYYFPLFCGQNISNKCGGKYAIYTVDAIPAPGWRYNINHKRFQRWMMSSYCKGADYFFAINQQMLDYQILTFRNKQSLKTGVIYQPIIETKVQLPQSKDDIILYTGGIYGDRKVEYIIKAFEKYLSINPFARILFVGSNLTLDYLSQYVSSMTLQNVDIEGYTINLFPYYKKAKVLLNIDSDVKHDVFIASKLLKYLTIIRMILSETGVDSPSRYMLGELATVVQCDHNVEELCNGIKHCIDNSGNVDYTERDNLLSQLSPNTVTSNLLKILKSNIN